MYFIIINIFLKNITVDSNYFFNLILASIHVSFGGDKMTSFLRKNIIQIKKKKKVQQVVTNHRNSKKRKIQKIGKLNINRITQN